MYELTVDMFKRYGLDQDWMYVRPSQTTSSSEETIQVADWIELNVLTKEESSVSVADVTATIAADPPRRLHDQ